MNARLSLRKCTTYLQSKSPLLYVITKQKSHQTRQDYSFGALQPAMSAFQLFDIAPNNVGGFNRYFAVINSALECSYIHPIRCINFDLS